MDVYFWQIQGSTKWEFDSLSYILNPGDLIYVPRGVYHSVFPLTPRVGISFGAEISPDDNYAK